MKEKKGGIFKYILFIAIIALAFYSIKKYLQYEHYSIPTDYKYTINDSIDIHYHNQLIVQQYYENVYRLSSFAEEQWFNYEIDVRFPDHENPQSILANETFLKMLSTTEYLEDLLKRSQELKTKGLDNKAVQTIEQTGVSIEDYQFNLKFSGLEMKEGDSGEQIALLQEKLVELGYEVPITGLYRKITSRSILDFQSKNKLFPTGKADKETLKKLFKQ